MTNMKDLTELRAEFEKLPYILNMRLINRVEYFSPYNNYGTNSTDINDHKACSFVNGAWYAYQEQEKLVSFLYSAINDALDGLEDGELNYCHKALRKALGDHT